VTTEPFYGPEQAAIHDEAFGHTATNAARLLLDRLEQAGLTEGTVVDLGCGTGILAARLAEAGYEVVGLDLSPAMLARARRAAPHADLRLGSVHDAELPRAVGVAAVGEVLNYATDPRAGAAALGPAFARVHDALVPGGVFVFDVAGPGRGGPGGGGQRFHVHHDWCMGTTVAEEGQRLTRDMVTFVPEGDGTSWRRVDEHHLLHLYRPEDVAQALERAGFSVERLPGYPGAAEDWVTVHGLAVFCARRPA
jgi:SAM-dependent methyltransferase